MKLQKLSGRPRLSVIKDHSNVTGSEWKNKNRLQGTLLKNYAKPLEDP